MTLPLSVCTSLASDNIVALSRIDVDSTFFITANKDGEFPLHLAALNNSVRCLELFTKKGNPDINMYNKHGRTALHLSSFHGHLEIVERLLSMENIQVNLKSKGNGCTALYFASCGGHVAVIDTLLRAGADPNITTLSNSTPLIGAAFSGNLACVETLIQAGADPSVKNDQGFTALYSAASNEHSHIVEYLLSRQSHQNSTDIQKKTLQGIVDAYREASTKRDAVVDLVSEGYLCFAEDKAKADTNSKDNTITIVKNVIEKIMKSPMKESPVKQNSRGGRRKHDTASPDERARDSSTHSGSRSAGDLSDKSNQTTVTEILV